MWSTAALAGLLTFASVAVPAACVAGTGGAAPDFTKLDAGLDRLRGAHGGAPAISVAIVERGQIVHAYATGSANVATSEAATPATRFRAASITKMFTAVSVMQLVEAGMLGLDDPVAKYVPGAPHADAITIRQLLSHTSGLPDVTDAAFSGDTVNSPTTPTLMLAPLVAAQLHFTPGAKFEYSNTNFIVLGQIVEALRGKPLADVERERILEPAGMTESSFGSAPPGVPVAIGYANGGTNAGAYDPSWLYGAGDLVTTPSDLARFDIALQSGKLVSHQTFLRMLEGGRPMGQGQTLYALGMTTTPFGSLTLAGHHGGVPGFAAENELTTDDAYAVVVMGNASAFDTSLVNALALQIVDPGNLGIAAVRTATDHAREVADLDPAIPQKLRTFLAGIASGTLDRTTLTKAMNDAITPAALAQLAAALPPYASLRSLTFVTHMTVAGGTIYIFTADYGTQKIDYRLVLDSDGKIAGFFLA